MAIVIRRALHQQEGEKVKSTAMPIDLQRGTAAEREDDSFESYPYQGYHRFTIADYLQGSNGSPYSRQYTKDGKLISCGISWYDSHVQRLDMMLRATGEPVALWRRKWTGETCPKCYTDRVLRGNKRCEICFGTGFVGGYVRYINPREPDGRIYVRVGPTEENLITDKIGLTQVFNPASWTLPTPIIRDRDFLIRYDPKTGEETWRYEVLSVTRNKGFFNVPTVQNFTMARHDKTDPIYKVRWVDLADNLVGRLAGDHDGADELQTQIENRFGDGFGDKGFSEGYTVGYLKGAADGHANKDFRDIPDLNVDGIVDSPYGPGVDTPVNKEAYYLGYQTGYEDGFKDGQEARRSEGYYVWQPPRFPGLPGIQVGNSDDYDERSRYPDNWKP